MKKFKKLIPALCMLLISAVLMGTSTYAWFSMNMNVSATGMTVTAKSNSTYLLIGTSDNKTDKENSNVSIIATNASDNVYPAAFNNTASAIQVGGKEIKAYSWYTANSKDPSKTGTGNEILNAVELTEAQLNPAEGNKYALINDFYLTLSKDSEDLKDGTLSVTLKKGEGAHEAVAVIIKVSSGEQSVYYSLSTTEAVTINNFNLTNATSYKVTVFTYFDGNNGSVTSNKYNENSAAFTGSVEVGFAIAFANA